MLGGGGSAFGPAPFLLGGGVGAAKSLLPSFLVPKGNQPTACTLALWWLKFGPTEGRGGGGLGASPFIRNCLLALSFELIFVCGILCRCSMELCWRTDQVAKGLTQMKE